MEMYSIKNFTTADDEERPTLSDLSLEALTNFFYTKKKSEKESNRRSRSFRRASKVFVRLTSVQEAVKAQNDLDTQEMYVLC